MPLRDHFRETLAKLTTWEGFYGQWPAIIVQKIGKQLPNRYVAEPRVHAGAPNAEYEVRIFDAERNRRLVAAIEIVSPANKDRPEHRQVFVAKCAALLRQGVSVVIVDLVTVRQFNLYGELLELIEQSDPALGEEPPWTYAVSCRWHRKAETKPKDAMRTIFEAWNHTLAVGETLPTLPLWLSDDFAVPLELESSYQQACSDLRIP